MTPTIRMLVLETDEPHPRTKASKGSFGAMFDTLFKEAGRIHIVEEPPKHKGHVPLTSEISEDISAILITGSMYDAHGDNPWILKLIDLLRQLWQERPHLRFSGVCFGHQILSRVLGAQVEPHPSGDWELAHTELDLTNRGKELFRTDRPTIELHQMHQDHVTTVPSSESTDLLSPQDRVHVWATTNHTQIQGMYLRDRLFTSQGHLGFDEKTVRTQVDMRIENGGIKDSRFAEERKQTAALKHDGIMVARAILRFFHGEDRDIE